MVLSAGGRRGLWWRLARAAVVVPIVSVVVVLSPGEAMAVATVVPMRAQEARAAVDRPTVLALPFAAQHVALHWRGNDDAVVSVAFSSDGAAFGAEIPVVEDEMGAEHPSGELFGAVMSADGARFARISSDRPLPQVNVLAMVDDAPRTVEVPAPTVGAAPAQPSVVSRAAWGADESYRFKRQAGKSVEVWPPDFHRVQKLIVHHTATANVLTSQEAAEQLRAIYYYHAVTQGWGDIGYNLIVDQLGTVYEGRYSGPASGARAVGEDDDGRIVTAGHTYQHNVGTVGVAILGDHTSQLPTTAARNALVALLAWEANRHQLSPTLSTTYRNVVNDLTRDSANVAGHSDYNATACPGEAFWYELPALRASVATAAEVGSGDTTAPPAPDSLRATGTRRQIALSWSAAAESWPAGSGVAYYEIQRATTPAGPFTAIQHTTDRTLAYTDSAIRGEYTYRVLAVDGAGNRGSFSPTATARAT